jgi:hypothetical protein
VLATVGQLDEHPKPAAVDGAHTELVAEPPEGAIGHERRGMFDARTAGSVGADESEVATGELGQGGIRVTIGSVSRTGPSMTRPSGIVSRSVSPSGSVQA